MQEVMLTTIDNPHSPFDEFKAWYAWDVASGYNTTEFLARISVLSDDLSDKDKMLANEQAIDEIVKENVTGMYKKITKEISDQ